MFINNTYKELLIEAGLVIDEILSTETEVFVSVDNISQHQTHVIHVALLGWEYIRSMRNILLAESDWSQLPDAVLTLDEKQAWQNYRQSLRDVPQNFATPKDVVFPTIPGGA
jgi:hypothetical protein